MLRLVPRHHISSSVVVLPIALVQQVDHRVSLLDHQEQAHELDSGVAVLLEGALDVLGLNVVKPDVLVYEV